MKKRTLVYPALLILIAIFVASCTGNPEPAAESEAPPESSEPESELQAEAGDAPSGDTAPDFSLPDAEGNMVNLAEQLQNNEFVALVFYNSFRCTVCMSQLVGLEEDRTKFEEKNVQLIAIAVQSQQGAANTVTKSKESKVITYPVLADEDHAVADAYNVYGIVAGAELDAAPAVFLIDKDSQIIWAEVAEKTVQQQRTSSQTILDNLPS